MKTLTVRQVPDGTHELLRIQAARHGRSMEEEVRRIIDEAVRRDTSIAAGPRAVGEEATSHALGEEVKDWRGKSPAKKRSPAEQAAAVERLQAFVRNLWGGELPGDIVDSFLEEKRAETARENAKEGF